jgi:predicted ester cyclase
MISNDANKQLVRRLVEEAINGRNLDVIRELADGELARAARRWIGPFRASFPDFTMEVVDVIAEGDRVVGHFRCSGTHLGEWNGIQPTGKRFHEIDEIYIFRVQNGRLTAFDAVEDNLPAYANSASIFARRSPSRFRLDRDAAVLGRQALQRPFSPVTCRGLPALQVVQRPDAIAEMHPCGAVFGTAGVPACKRVVLRGLAQRLVFQRLINCSSHF